MKYISKILVFVIAGVLITSCGKDFLNYQPQGVVTKEEVSTSANIDKLVIAAYAGIANDEMIGPMTSMWVYGSVRSDDAYKGGGGVDDVGDVNKYEQYYLTTPDQGGSDWMAPRTWTNYYKAISRINLALSVANDLDIAQFPAKAATQGELRFLRGHCYFMMKRLFNKVPFIDETMTEEQILQTSNDLTSDALWNKIGDDFQFALANLPETQDQVGRANKLAAAAYLAKTRLYQAYEQDENHSVTTINTARLQEVVDLTATVLGRYSLQADYAENFLDGYDNDVESIFAAQFSLNDGTEAGRASYVTGLNSPTGTPLYGCCDFHKASQNMVNAFKTDANGLPMFDTFNNSDMVQPADFLTNGIDPRLDHTVGVPGHPFKYRPGLINGESMIYQSSWARVPGVYGFFSNMKEQQAPDCACYFKKGPFMGTSKNIDFIRYGDVLLMRAEALIQLNRQAEALPLINQIRARAKASTGMTKLADGTNPSNYRIDEYKDGVNISWTKENAWKALMFERRLEFGMEGDRFFDLVRWGIAAETLNAYLTEEKTKRDFLSFAHFTKGRDEYYPIPQREITFTKGLYGQNPGY
ncbi:MAG: RagB/SusD family nutrient uptake outer membrane protein [Bacteroidales bacterium]|nr:RagB/SusD family nutrient uptake outer membrane protein [Bacteroidales bacterium]